MNGMRTVTTISRTIQKSAHAYEGRLEMLLREAPDTELSAAIEHDSDADQLLAPYGSAVYRRCESAARAYDSSLDLGELAAE